MGKLGIVSIIITMMTLSSCTSPDNLNEQRTPINDTPSTISSDWGTNYKQISLPYQPYKTMEVNGVTFSGGTGINIALFSESIKNFGKVASLPQDGNFLTEIKDLAFGSGIVDTRCELEKFTPEWKEVSGYEYYKVSSKFDPATGEGFNCGPIYIGPSAPGQYLIYSYGTKGLIFINTSQDPYPFDPTTLSF